MRTLTFKTAVSGTISATPALDLKVQEHGSQTWEIFTDSANCKVTLFSVFTDTDGIETEAQLKEITLTAGTLEVLNYDMKLEHVRAKFSDTGSSMSGTLRIKATASRK